MFRLVILLIIGAISTGAARPVDDSLRQEYRRILLEVHSGGHASQGLEADEFLAQPMIKTLLSEYRKSMRKTGHPAASPSRPINAAFHRLYEKHLLEIAMREERAELNNLVQSTFEGEPTDLELETRHMKILGKINDEFSTRLVDGYNNDDSEKMQVFGALSVFILTEAYVRLSLFSLGYKLKLSTFERMASVLTPDLADSVINKFWISSNLPENQTLPFALLEIEKFSGKGFSELVTEYQKLIATDGCAGLLAPRHPSSEG
jgi:hypothetical protein